MAGYIPRWYTRPKTVTHLGINNRARRALTSFMRRTPISTTRRRQLTCRMRRSVRLSTVSVEKVRTALVAPDSRISAPADSPHLLLFARTHSRTHRMSPVNESYSHHSGLRSYRRFMRNFPPQKSDLGSYPIPTQSTGIDCAMSIHLRPLCAFVNYQLYIISANCQSAPQSNTSLVEPTRVSPSNGFSIGSSVFAGLVVATNTQTLTHGPRKKLNNISTTNRSIASSHDALTVVGVVNKPDEFC